MGKKSADSKRTGTPSALFFSLGIDMSWRLALSVLVPIIGGVELDKTLKTSPVLLIIGFALAIILSVITIRRTLKITNDISVITSPKTSPKEEQKKND